MKNTFFVFFLCLSSFAFSQIGDRPPKPSTESDSLPRRKDSLALNTKPRLDKQKVEESKKITIQDYKIISSQGDTTFLDTTLTIQKEYKYNVLRKDDFELMSFANVGQQYNALGKSFEQTVPLPNIGAAAKHVNYLESDDVKYYHVPTPMTELFFKTVFEQGQFLDAVLTLNTSERFNFSIAFNGFRSLGKYQYEQAQSGRFRTTFNYRTKNNRYWVRGHFASQDIKGEESGGLSNKETQFESGSDDFLDRSRIDVFYTNADSRLLGRRYYLDHQFNLVRPRTDSVKTTKTRIAIGHKFQYESRYFQFTQSSAPSSPAVFGSSFLSSIDDKASLEVTQNQLSAIFSNPKWGDLKGMLDLYDYNYFFKSLLVQEDEQIISNQLNGNEILIGGSYRNKIGPLSLEGSIRYGLSGDVTGSLIDANASYNFDASNKVYASVHGSSRMPNFNFLLYQSDYENFNWQNDQHFNKQKVQSIAVGADFKWFGDVSAKFTAIDNYTYFASEATPEDIEGNLETAFVKPFQDESTINYLRVKWNKEFKWRKWALNNTMLYQEVAQDEQVLNLPQLLTRNTIYFSSDVFEKAMFLQTGVTLKYFTSYNMDAYHPLLGEFYIQNNEELGAYPLLDVFINAKVRRTRIYFKAEHINTIWSKNYDYYVAPNYPYRDFVIRFGLVWNFFS